MTGLTSHVLDLALGQPARGLAVRLEVPDGATWRVLARAVTDDDGRAGGLAAALPAGTYRLAFETGAYFASTGRASFYPYVEVTFQITATGQHHHVPLLLSPHGYTTYRGS